MLLKVVFDKTAFVKFKISNNSKQNIDETHSKQLKTHRNMYTIQWVSKISRKKSGNNKSRHFCQMFVISKRIPYPGYGFKNVKKVYSLAYGFLFFVISIPEQSKSCN
jgi:hypothetical protein